MSHEALLCEVRDGVAHLTLNRPDNANTLDPAMARDLMHATIACDEDPRVRAVLLTGAGSMFCAGGDIKSFDAAADALPAFIKEVTTYLHAGLSRLARMRAPVVAAVNGAAAGAGMSLACAADLVVAAESARFTMAYTRIGLVPDGSSTYYLPRVVGLRRAQELMLTNRVLSAREALEWGIVTRVVPDSELAGEAGKLAASLASGPSEAFASVKRLLLSSLGNSLESQMELETRGIAAAGGSADGREGIAAFLAKRPPKFTGR